LEKKPQNAVKDLGQEGDGEVSGRRGWIVEEG